MPTNLTNSEIDEALAKLEGWHTEVICGATWWVHASDGSVQRDSLNYSTSLDVAWGLATKYLSHEWEKVGELVMNYLWDEYSANKLARALAEMVYETLEAEDEK